MKQDFVYHTLARPEARPRRAKSTAVAANPTEAVKEYLAYISLLSIAVEIAIVTFAYAAYVTVRWLDVIAKPGFFAASTQTVAPPGDNATAPTKFAMLPAAVPSDVKN